MFLINCLYGNDVLLQGVLAQQWLIPEAIEPVRMINCLSVPLLSVSQCFGSFGYLPILLKLGKVIHLSQCNLIPEI